MSTHAIPMTADAKEPSPAVGWRMAFRFARRELRGGLKGFRLMMACLALGVGAIAGIGSFSATIDESLHNDARALLGGDAELRLTQRRASSEELTHLQQSGSVSMVASMRAMAATVPSSGEFAANWSSSKASTMPIHCSARCGWSRIGR
jgi:predicted lysophospholipase L1 biosynthesis ABC-type transport system permease subunit